jgi:hypothetical protein
MTEETERERERAQANYVIFIVYRSDVTLPLVTRCWCIRRLLNETFAEFPERSVPRKRKRGRVANTAALHSGVPGSKSSA